MGKPKQGHPSMGECEAEHVRHALQAMLDGGTRQQLAASLGMTVQGLGKLLSGASRASHGTAARVAELRGTRLDWLLKGLATAPGRNDRPAMESRTLVRVLKQVKLVVPADLMPVLLACFTARELTEGEWLRVAVLLAQLRELAQW